MDILKASTKQILRNKHKSARKQQSFVLDTETPALLRSYTARRILERTASRDHARKLPSKFLSLLINSTVRSSHIPGLCKGQQVVDQDKGLTRSLCRLLLTTVRTKTISTREDPTREEDEKPAG